MEVQETKNCQALTSIRRCCMFYIYQLTEFSQLPCEGLTPLIQTEAKFKGFVESENKIMKLFQEGTLPGFTDSEDCGVLAVS